MSIYRDSNGGSLIIERRIQGRLFKRATGLPDTSKGRKTAGLYDKMIDTLIEGGRSELVWAIGDSLSFADIWQHYRLGQWERIPSPEQMRPLFTAVEAWLPRARKNNGQPIGDRHRSDMRKGFETLKELRPGACIAELPELLQEYRDACEAEGIGRTFNRTRAYVQAFLRETYGKRRNYLWGEASDVPVLPCTRAEGHPQSPADAIAIRNRLGEHHGPIWWSMCVTGMMPDELWQEKYRLHVDHAHIMGTKTLVYRDRLVPRIGDVVTPSRQYKAFREALKDIDASLRPYDGRRTFSHWLEIARLPESRQDAYMGHAIRDVGGLYRRHDVRPHLAEDRLALLALPGMEAA